MSEPSEAARRYTAAQLQDFITRAFVAVGMGADDAGKIAALMADFSGMVSVDVGLRTTVEVEGHQGYSFLFTIFYGFITVYSYTKAFSRTAYIYYGLSFLAMCACAISGYSLVFK